MQYKISSLILNAGKHQTGSREVFVSQPDAIKENLAGKLFFLAEIDGKKTDMKKVVDFVISNLEDFYYNDEKLFLQDKIEGLSLDNIFEAALTKLNKALLDFLAADRIKLKPEDTNFSVGVIFEDKLLFSNFGRNKSFLIFKRQNDFELINVESSAADSTAPSDNINPTGPKFFASVISGEIPPSAYFIFCNEALPEYLSNKDLINIITKLPPMVASEQIKSTLSKLNSYVPFLGIIIKNTIGSSDLAQKEDVLEEDYQSAHHSISHLNSTEKRTEQMLAPTGLFNWKKFSKIWKKVNHKVGKNVNLKSITPAKSLASLNKQKTISAAKMIKEKISFGRSHSHLKSTLSAVGATLLNLFNPKFWRNILSKVKTWLKSLNSRNRLMITLLSLTFIVLLVSVIMSSINNRKQAEAALFHEKIAALEEKKSMIDSYLLYNNEEGAKTLIGESIIALDALEVKGEAQINLRNSLLGAIEKQRDQVQKLTKVDSLEMIGNFQDYNPAAETRNLLIFDNKAYVADPAGKAIYSLDLNSKEKDSILLSGDIVSLDQPVAFDDKIYYLNNNNLISVDPKAGKNTALNLSGVGADDYIASFQFYDISGKPLYLLMPEANQVYKLTAQGSSYGAKTAWMKANTPLSDAISIAVSSDIYVLRDNGSMDKYKRGVKQDFNLASVDPVLSSASIFKLVDSKLAIFDKSSKRLFLFNVDGSLIHQYQLATLNNIKDFSFSADFKTAYILNDDSIYQLKL
ncbi:hypothetical protein K9M09_01220 [Patescibacteria group bacterium]|nr:hypothetical protein [Patescibacteria group bacterium]